jgi:hypothetical protein
LPSADEEKASPAAASTTGDACSPVDPQLANAQTAKTLANGLSTRRTGTSFHPTWAQRLRS